jgi:predicted 2-oxoglutarate/Fe(II)-dependent dioxygenase YbiX/alkyl hydroperoxide reductase subunit AhpC
MSDHPLALTSRILPGDPAPWFYARTPANPRYTFDTAGGRYIVLCFLGSGGDPQAQAAMRAVLGRNDLFNDRHTALFAVSNDPEDERQTRLANRVPGIRIIWDFDRAIHTAYGVASNDTAQDHRCWIVIDPTLRVIANIAFRADGGDAAQVMALLDALPPPDRFAGVELHAPVLVLPRVFEPELCTHLIDLYETHGGTESGFMREIGGRTLGVHDHNHKRRKDHILTDPALISELQKRFVRRVVPEIAKIHQFTVTRMERYIVSCYAAEDGGHFAAHRDNTTAGTAHRRFAVSVNLNDDFDGGEVSFPEYGARGFKAPPGGAVVFSCSLLHRVSRVTRGQRYAFLPFLYDNAAALIRQKNATLIGEAPSG